MNFTSFQSTTLFNSVYIVFYKNNISYVYTINIKLNDINSNNYKPNKLNVNILQISTVLLNNFTVCFHLSKVLAIISRFLVTL